MVYLNEGFNGLDGLYADDIAVIVLANKVSFSNGVAPVCIDWKSRYNVNNGDQGRVNNMLYYIVCSFIKYTKHNLKLVFRFIFLKSRKRLRLRYNFPVNFCKKRIVM